MKKTAIECAKSAKRISELKDKTPEITAKKIHKGIHFDPEPSVRFLFVYSCYKLHQTGMQ